MSATSRTTGLAGRRGGRGGSREHQTSRTRGAYHKFFRVSILGMLISSVYSKNRAKDSPVVFQLYPEKWICWPSLFTQGNDWSKMRPPVVRVYLVAIDRPLRGGRHTEPPRPRYNTVPNDGVHLCRCPRRSACAGRAPPRLPRRTRAHPRRCLRAGCPRGDPFHGGLSLRLRLRQGHRAQAERGPLRLLREFPRTSTRYPARMWP